MYLVLVYKLLDLSYVPSSVVVTSAPPSKSASDWRLGVREGGGGGPNNELGGGLRRTKKRTA